MYWFPIYLSPKRAFPNRRKLVRLRKKKIRAAGHTYTNYQKEYGWSDPFYDYNLKGVIK